MGGRDEISEELKRVYAERAPDGLIGRGHAAGDVLEAWHWRVVRQAEGQLRIACHLPPALLNPRGVLFGGFTSTYVDLAAIFTVQTTRAEEEPRRWLNTVNMRLDYMEPIETAFEIDNRVVNRRGRSIWVESRFLDAGERMLAYALTTLREVADPAPGDG